MSTRGKDQIREALKGLMSDGEANACVVFKGYDAGTGLYGWHYVPFGRGGIFLGDTIADALEAIGQIAEERAAQFGNR